MENQFSRIIKNKRTYYFLFLAILIYGVFLFYAEYKGVAFNLKSLNWTYIPVIVLSVLAAHSLALLRWIFLLRKLKKEIPWKKNLKIYLSSWAMFFAPAKSGELVKGFFLKKLYAVPYKESMPVIFIEMLTDLVSVVLFSLLGVYFFKILPLNKTIILFLVVVVLIILALMLLSFKTGVSWVIDRLKKVSFLKKRMEELEQMYLTAGYLTRPGILIVSLLLGMGFWFFFGLVLYFLFYAFGVKLTILVPVAIFCLSTLIGFLSFIPAGIGVMEASTFVLLISQGVPETIAAVGLVLARIFTLWLGVAMGLFSLGSLNKELIKERSAEGEKSKDSTSD